MDSDPTARERKPVVSRTARIVVRERRASDTRAVRRIARTTWRATYEGRVPNAFIRAILRRGYDRRRMVENLLDPARHAFVAEADGHLVGYADLREGDPLEHELTRIYVLPTVQHTGCGRALLSRCVDVARARGARRLALDVDPANAPAISWYERRGFRRLGTEPFTVGRITRPALRMALDIGDGPIR